MLQTTITAFFCHFPATTCSVATMHRITMEASLRIYPVTTRSAVTMPARTTSWMEFFCHLPTTTRSSAILLRSTEASLNPMASICTIPATTLYTITVSYTHLRAHETRHDLVCRL